MEKNASSLNPLLLFWQSPKVRDHVVAAGRELALAVHAGLEALQTQATESGLTEQYPYLHAALHNVRSTVGQWINATEPMPHAHTPEKKPRGPRGKRTTK